MKLKVLRDDSLRISSGLWVSVKADTKIDLPRAHAAVLIERGSAEPVPRSTSTPAEKD
jgi:hypothetical protein